MRGKVARQLRKLSGVTKDKKSGKTNQYNIVDNGEDTRGTIINNMDGSRYFYKRLKEGYLTFKKGNRDVGSKNEAE